MTGQELVAQIQSIRDWQTTRILLQVHCESCDNYQCPGGGESIDVVYHFEDPKNDNNPAIMLQS